MDNKTNPIWSRRTNTSNLSLSTGQTDNPAPPRDYSSLSRRTGATSSHGRTNPFNSATTPGGGMTSPAGGGGSSAFGLGSGAFASFGSAKTPKTPGNPFEKAIAGSKTPSAEKSSKDPMKPSMASAGDSEDTLPPSSHPLLDTWVFWTRPPISKANGYIEYEKTLHPIAQARTVEEFWTVYRYLKPPSTLPLVTDYHFFRNGVRPIWEDQENKSGGKWILRLKKGVADRYWEEVLMACAGGQFTDADVNGAVLSVRNGEDIISIWTSSTGQRVLKIRDTMKSVLKCPATTHFEFKSHDASMQQRATIDEQRREKAATHQGEKRAARNNDNNAPRQPPAHND